MKIWIVSLEWNRPPSEVTGDTGIVGVYATEALARASQRETQREFDEDGDQVYRYSMGGDLYCTGCGERATDKEGKPHVCQSGFVDEFCSDCGAELNDNDSCDNDHDDWDIDVHCTEHTIKGETPLDRIHQTMNGKHWDADTNEAVAGILTDAGYVLAEPDGDNPNLCPTCHDPQSAQVVPKGSGDAMCAYCGADWPAEVTS